MSRLKFLIASDSHGRVELLLEAIKRNRDVDAVIFLGDGLSDFEFVSEYFSELNCQWLAVKGNCDYEHTFRNSPVKKTEILTVEDKRIVYTHGDLYNVKLGQDGLYSLAQQTGADIVLYGHTHIQREEYKDGVYYVNPGALWGDSSRSCALLTLDGGSVLFSYLRFV